MEGGKQVKEKGNISSQIEGSSKHGTNLTVSLEETNNEFMTFFLPLLCRAKRRGFFDSLQSAVEVT